MTNNICQLHDILIRALYYKISAKIHKKLWKRKNLHPQSLHIFHYSSGFSNKNARRDNVMLQPLVNNIQKKKEEGGVGTLLPSKK